MTVSSSLPHLKGHLLSELYCPQILLSAIICRILALRMPHLCHHMVATRMGYSHFGYREVVSPGFPLLLSEIHHCIGGLAMLPIACSSWCHMQLHEGRRGVTQVREEGRGPGSREQ